MRPIRRASRGPKIPDESEAAGVPVDPIRQASSAYVDGLRLVARRELSEVQVRQRLAGRGHDQEAIDAAVARLREERAIDDARTAAAIARTETSIKRRGRRRVNQQLERAGIPASVARTAADQVFGDLDEDALINQALDKRLRHGRGITDEPEFARLYRYLIAQGFESDRVLRTLNTRRKGEAQ